jgi:hypothetical protein
MLSSEMWRRVLRKKSTDSSEELAASIAACGMLLAGYLVGLLFYPDDGSSMFPEESVNYRTARHHLVLFSGYVNKETASVV